MYVIKGTHLRIPIYICEIVENCVTISFELDESVLRFSTEAEAQAAVASFPDNTTLEIVKL